MLQLDQLFNLSQTAHASLFDGVEYPWLVLPKLEEYIQELVEEGGIESDVYRATFIGDKVITGKNCVVEPGAVIKGPAVLGDNVTIRSGAYIRENVIIGDNVMIGNSCEVKNSLIFNDVEIPHFNYIGDSIIGHNAHLGSSVVLSNHKSDGSSIAVKDDDNLIQTGLEKFGALVGDNVEIGASAVLNPGTIVGMNATIYPLALVRGIVKPNTILKVRQQHELVERNS